MSADTRRRIAVFTRVLPPSGFAGSTRRTRRWRVGARYCQFFGNVGEELGVLAPIATTRILQAFLHQSMKYDNTIVHRMVEKE
ncbi:hypothetical protein ACIBO5_48790 [Nonomuraea angiospora]|uniref:hypothetical protein n=1 Tax=Nonomuraea angiospora TaxID=46172 RepID=UPI0029A0390D|nr:hypothetical protein [Nonomuraea angiospora]MDX3101890.1 hypothetical protein [Nonomuraea angiospora]